MGYADVIHVLSRYPGFRESLNARGPYNGYTPLHDAVWHGHTKAVRALLEAGVRKDLRGYDGRTPIDLVKEYHYDGIANLLSDKQHAE